LTKGTAVPKFTPSSWKVTVPEGIGRPAPDAATVAVNIND